jgi:hypothetical protein
MNRLCGKISHLTTSGNMTLVDVDVGGAQITAITIGIPERTGYLQISKNIELLFNESEVSIGKLIQGHISLRIPMNPATCSDLNRPPVPNQKDHLI